MTALSSLSDTELVARLTGLVRAERQATADVIEHWVEVERRRLYLSHRVGSLFSYCMKQLGYDEDAATKRNRVAKLAIRLPQVLDELRAGTIHLTGLFLLAGHLVEANAGALLGEARGKSRREIEKLMARWFPRSDVPASIEPLPANAEHLALGGPAPATAGVEKACSGAGKGAARHLQPVAGRLEPLSPTRVRVEFTARAEIYEKLEKARELLSHAIPSGDLGELLERALDALLERETRKGSGSPASRKPRKLKPGSRHVPVSVERAVWERDKSQCTHVNANGLPLRCPACTRNFTAQQSGVRSETPEALARAKRSLPLKDARPRPAQPPPRPRTGCTLPRPAPGCRHRHEPKSRSRAPLCWDSRAVSVTFSSPPRPPRWRHPTLPGTLQN